MTRFVPNGQHQISPYLTVEDARKMIQFLEQGLDGKELERTETADGRIMNALIQLGDSTVMVGERPGSKNLAANSVHFYVPDVDAVYQKALAAGATSISAPQDFFYGDRSCGVTDPCGQTWWIGTHREDVSPEQMRERVKAFSRK